MREADYIVVGAGSAGCALAYRLSEDGRNSVLVLEYGGSDRGPLIQMPAALSIPMNMRTYDWGYRSEPEPPLGGRRLATPRGKVVGGSSSINGMVFVRGHPADFDRWEAAGAKGWGFRHVLPYFKRMETAHLNGGAADADGAQGWRGHDGPLHVTRGSMANPLYKAFTVAGIEAGYGYTPDYNGARQEGFGAMEMTVWEGRRWSAANAYLRPALKRPNVALRTGHLAERIVFEGRRAVGVVASRWGQVETYRARKEVVIAASAINAPKLLMLSGIGPAEHLRQVGVDVVAHRPGVGGNLQDHLEVCVQQACMQPITLNAHLGLLARARIGLEWILFGTGLGATNHFEACAFIRSAAGVPYPDLQLHFLPAAVRYDGKAAAAAAHGFQVHIGPMRSPSRGTIRLASPDPKAAPVIRFNYMSAEKDWTDFRAAIRLTREIFAQPALAAYCGKEIAPGAAQSDAELDAFVRENVESAYHPCGTCRMGAVDDVNAVVDSDCRVIGTYGLRVADSSVFPEITNGNINAPSIMVGEKAADIILGKPPLPAANVEPWTHAEWRTRQR